MSQQKLQRDRPFKWPVQLIHWKDRYRCPLPIKINPYRGCEHNCQYCYLFRSRRVKGVDEAIPVSADINDIKKRFNEVGNGKHNSYLHQCLEQKIPVQIGTSTDPFQPIEKKEQITYQLLEFLKEIEYPWTLTTKGIIPDDYLHLIKDQTCTIHQTITTFDTKITNKLEQNAPKPKERLENIYNLANNDINVQLRLWPIIPGITDDYIEVAKEAEEAGVKNIVTSFLRNFKYKAFQERMNKALGYNYIEKLKDMDYPLRESSDMYVIPFWKMKEVYNEIKEAVNIPLFTPDVLYFNNFKSCCGTEDFLGSHCDWALNTRAQKIQNHTTFKDYINGCDCPFEEQFERFWRNGYVRRVFSDIHFNRVSHTYSRLDNKSKEQKRLDYV